MSTKIGKTDINVVRSLTKVLLQNEVYFQELLAKQDSIAAKKLLMEKIKFINNMLISMNAKKD